MGDAFDDWLIEKIQILRRGSVVASGIRRVEQVTSYTYLIYWFLLVLPCLHKLSAIQLTMPLKDFG